MLQPRRVEQVLLGGCERLFAAGSRMTPPSRTYSSEHFFRCTRPQRGKVPGRSPRLGLRSHPQCLEGPLPHREVADLESGRRSRRVTRNARAGSRRDAGTAAELTKCVEPLLRGLEQPYRDALQWIAFDGMIQEAAAKRANMSLSGMKSRVQRGRTKLRDLFDNCCTIEVDAAANRSMQRCRGLFLRDR